MPQSTHPDEPLVGPRHRSDLRLLRLPFAGENRGASAAIPGFEAPGTRGQDKGDERRGPGILCWRNGTTSPGAGPRSGARDSRTRSRDFQIRSLEIEAASTDSALERWITKQSPRDRTAGPEISSPRPGIWTPSPRISSPYLRTPTLHPRILCRAPGTSSPRNGIPSRMQRRDLECGDFDSEPLDARSRSRDSLS